MNRIDAVLIDWGTTNVRAYGIGADGAILERRVSAHGIRNVPDRQFAAAFDALVGDWRASAPVPVLMSGMIGSRQGWAEAPYVACPAGLDDLADGLLSVPDRSGVRIVPGVCLGASASHRDVMRGEEVQCFGAVAIERIADAILCLPGTHSKWVRMEGGRLVDFATAMTGEAYEVLRRHSILSALIRDEETGAPGDSRWFAAGLERSGEPGGLLHHLFSVRADGLFDIVPGEGLADYLSGILIGHEIRSMAGLFPAPRPVLVVGGSGLAAAYRAALSHLEVEARAIDAEKATTSGLFRILSKGRSL